jgi:hypothetical protein
MLSRILLISLFIGTFNAYSSTSWPICQSNGKYYYLDSFKKNIWFDLDKHKRLVDKSVSEDVFEKMVDPMNKSLNAVFEELCKKNPDNGFAITVDFRNECESLCSSNAKQLKQPFFHKQACINVCDLRAGEISSYLSGVDDSQKKMNSDLNRLSKACQESIDLVQADVNKANISNKLKNEIKEDFLPVMKYLKNAKGNHQ